MFSPLTRFVSKSVLRIWICLKIRILSALGPSVSAVGQEGRWVPWEAVITETPHSNLANIDQL